MNKEVLIKRASISTNITLNIRKRYRIKTAEESGEPEYWGSDLDKNPSLFKGWRNNYLKNDFFFNDGSYDTAGLWGAGIGGVVGSLVNLARGKNLLTGALVGAGVGAGIGAGGKYLNDTWIRPKILEGWQRDVEHDANIAHPEWGGVEFEDNGRDYHPKNNTLNNVPPQLPGEVSTPPQPPSPSNSLPPPEKDDISDLDEEATAPTETTTLNFNNNYRYKRPLVYYG